MGDDDENFFIPTEIQQKAQESICYHINIVLYCSKFESNFSTVILKVTLRIILSNLI